MSAFKADHSENMKNPEYAYQYGRTERELEVVKLLEPLGECEPSICGKGCRGEYRCIGWAYRHAIRLIKAEGVQEPAVSTNDGQATFTDKGENK